MAFDWGKHLRADFMHDGFRTANYNIGGIAAARDPARRTEYSEEFYWTEVMGPGGTAAGIPEINARIERKIHFKIPEKTESFEPLPMLDVTGNASLGIVMDAGANITEELGAKNVITFGMCLDPASSPIAPSRNPMFFYPGPGVRVNINLAEFGFAPEAIRTLQISNIDESGTAVDTRWIMGNGEEYDPMKGTGYKIINKIGGNYVGREAVGDLNDMIGKTMGDAMIVASAMPVFDGGVRNTYYGGLAPGGARYGGQWRKLNSPTAIPDADIPSTLVVKTGDRLNAIRAIFKNVPVILEKYVDDRVIKQFDYYPNTVDARNVLGQIVPSYVRIRNAIIERYRVLIEQFEMATDNKDDPATIILQVPYSRFITEVSKHAGNVLGREEPARRKAGLLFYDIRQKLGQLKDATLRYFSAREEYFRTRIAAPAAVPSEIVAEYNQDLEALKNLCPQTSAIVRDPVTRIMNPIVPLVQPFTIPGMDPIPGIEIRLLSAFQSIIANSPNYDGTVYSQRFVLPANEFLRILPPPAPVDPVPAAPAPVGPPVDAVVAAAASPEGDLDDYARDIIGEGEVRGGGQSGGGQIFLIRSTDALGSVLANTAPILTKFIEYYDEFDGKRKPNRVEYVKAALHLFAQIKSPRIASPVLLERMLYEFIHLEETGVLSVEDNGVPDVVLRTSTRDSLIYNAFCMHINNLNLNEPNTSGFHILERKFREAATAVAQRTRATQRARRTERAQEMAAARRVAEAEAALAAAMAAGDDGGAGVAQAERELVEARAYSAPLYVDAPAAARLAGVARNVSMLSSNEGTPERSVAPRVVSLETVRRSESEGSYVASPPSIPFRTRIGDSPPRGPSGGRRTPRRKNRKSTYRLKKKPSE